MRWWDKSWNPITGCVPCSEGCKNCVSLKNLKKQGRSCSPQFSSVSMEKELLSGMNYLVCSLGDMFDYNDWNQIDFVFKKIIKVQNSQFFICTKKTDQLMEYMEDAPWNFNDIQNIWFGCSIENKSCLHRAEDLLNTVEIAHRYIQVEPLLEQIDFSNYLEGIDWLIIGCETGENARDCELSWVRDLVAQARSKGVPVFINYLRVNGVITDNIDLFPTDLKIREIPWRDTFDFKERHDLFDGRAAIFKLPDGNIEIHCPVSIYWKLSKMIKSRFEPFGFKFRGVDVKNDILTECVMSSIELFHKLKENEDLKPISWDFLPKELLCKCILNGKSMQSIAGANDKELKEINKSIKSILE